ncbi:hypothetical protein ABTM61_20340, partial [Acinetobacter baumannii]
QTRHGVLSADFLFVEAMRLRGRWREGNRALVPRCGMQGMCWRCIFSLSPFLRGEVKEDYRVILFQASSPAIL